MLWSLAIGAISTPYDPPLKSDMFAEQLVYNVIARWTRLIQRRWMFKSPGRGVGCVRSIPCYRCAFETWAIEFWDGNTVGSHGLYTLSRHLQFQHLWRGNTGNSFWFRFRKTCFLIAAWPPSGHDFRAIRWAKNRTRWLTTREWSAGAVKVACAWLKTKQRSQLGNNTSKRTTIRCI